MFPLNCYFCLQEHADPSKTYALSPCVMLLACVTWVPEIAVTALDEEKEEEGGYSVFIIETFWGKLCVGV